MKQHKKEPDVDITGSAKPLSKDSRAVFLNCLPFKDTYNLSLCLHAMFHPCSQFSVQGSILRQISRIAFTYFAIGHSEYLIKPNKNKQARYQTQDQANNISGA